MGTKLCYHENPLEERTGILYIYIELIPPKNDLAGLGRQIL